LVSTIAYEGRKMRYRIKEDVPNALHDSV
jgi:hypothetical protein